MFKKFYQFLAIFAGLLLLVGCEKGSSDESQEGLLGKVGTGICLRPREWYHLQHIVWRRSRQKRWNPDNICRSIQAGCQARKHHDHPWDTLLQKGRKKRLYPFLQEISSRRDWKTTVVQIWEWNSLPGTTYGSICFELLSWCLLLRLRKIPRNAYRVHG